MKHLEDQIQRQHREATLAIEKEKRRSLLAIKDSNLNVQQRQAALQDAEAAHKAALEAAEEVKQRAVEEAAEMREAAERERGRGRRRRRRRRCAVSRSSSS